MAVALSSNEFERTIEVLSSAGQTLQLTRFERLSYRTLLVSADVVLASLFVILASVVIAIFIGGGPAVFIRSSKDHDLLQIGFLGILGVAALFFALSLLVGIVSLALSIPLLLKTFREERRLKRLGLSSLSISLWKESRRSRWMSRLRGVLLVGIGIYILVSVAAVLVEALIVPDLRQNNIILFVIALSYAIIVGFLFATRYLRNQRERMDLAASAGELRKALLSLRERNGSDFVSVPAELLEQSAKIESAQITQERKDAVLQSAAFRPNSYAIAFNHDATQQRARLDVADRVELEDLVAELSTSGAQLEPQAETISGTKDPTLLAATKSKQLEVEYVIDHASRGIHVIAVRQAGEAFDTLPDGAGHV
jgi:hypothetical protein